MKNLLTDDGGIIGNPVVPNPKDTSQGIGAGFISQNVPRFISLGLVIGVLVFFFVMLIGAIQWIASGGDKAAIEAARSKIVNALIGIIVLFSVFVILKIIGDFFGITTLQLMKLNIIELLQIK
jgi:hypothetical protein